MKMVVCMGFGNCCDVAGVLTMVYEMVGVN